MNHSLVLVLNSLFGKYAIGIQAAMIACCCFSVQADALKEMVCHVDSSDDLFKVYPRQLAYTGEQFNIYQLIDGLTVLIVNTQTMRFNRLSSLNLLPRSTLDPSWPAEPPQFFSGWCEHLTSE